jgi:electron transport complex protein RnfD
MTPRYKPQINVSRSTSGLMWLVFCCAALGVVQSAISDRGLSLIVALTALCSAVLAELLITFRGSGFRKLKDGSAAASAMVLALLLPNQIHPVYAALGALFAMAVVKHSFGGLGSNRLNPGLGGWLFIRFSWPGVFGKALEGASGGIAAPEALGAVSALDGRATGFLNKWIFSFLGADLPLGYIDLLIPERPGIIADRGLLALLLGTVIITAFHIGRSWVPAVFLTVFGILARTAGDPPFEGFLRGGDALYALCSGGTIVAAFILAVEPASGAKSRPGILLATIASGVLSWVFRFRGFELYGCFFAIALVNVFTQMIRLFENRWFYSRRRQAAGSSPEAQA